MLRFFRIIRRSLLELSQVRTYFFYAIGEIALVVIGILIALQVNNWNEERNDSRQINLYLENLAETLHEELDNYKRMASLNAYRYNGLQYLLEISGNEKINHDPIPIDTFSSVVLKHLGDCIITFLTDFFQQYHGDRANTGRVKKKYSDPSL